MRCGKRPKRAITSRCFLAKPSWAFVAEAGELQDGAILIDEILAVLERHVEKAALLRFKVFIKTAIDRCPGDLQSQMVGRELLGIAAEHVARELVEQDDGGERG